MNRNYRRPEVAANWAESRETHKAVAMAIHAIADSKRSPEQIWEDPTPAEVDHVTIAVEEYVTHGDFDADENFWWGNETKVTW
jgi:hypothetical protein